MTKEEAIQHRDVIIGYTNGRTVQIYNKTNQRWEDAPNPIFKSDCKYRIEPESELKYRPFTYNEFYPHANKWLLYKNSDMRRTLKVIGLDNNLVAVGDKCFTYKELLETFTFMDGSPCGVVI